jgi:hypothetical protein
MLEGTMAICQNGNSLNARYILAQTEGSITGTVSGDRVTGTWTEYEGDGVTPAGSGRIVMALFPNNNGWQAWYTFSNSLPDTSGPAPWTATRTGTCPGCGSGGVTRTFQTVATPALHTAVTTTLPWQVKPTTSPVAWQTAIPTTQSGSTCGPHCNDPSRQCGIWDARWHHKTWGDNQEGDMTLCQNGNIVTGTYNIAQTQGSISGTVSGTELRGTWREYEGDGVTVAIEGDFIYRMKSGNSAWDGWFNYNPGNPVDTGDTATWTGTKR